MKYVGDLHNISDSYSAKFGLLGSINGDADAFRHALSSAMMARDFGAALAASAGMAWEIIGLIGEGTFAESRWINGIIPLAEI